MSYELYEIVTNMSYEEFARGYDSYMTSSIRTAAVFIIMAVIMFLIGKRSNYKLDPESCRKLKQICKWEKRPVRYQVKHILEMYIDAYSEKNGIDWEQRLY